MSATQVLLYVTAILIVHGRRLAIFTFSYDPEESWDSLMSWIGHGLDRENIYLTELMSTWLQWVSTGPQLSMPLVPRLSPSPPRTLTNCLRLPLSSAMIMIIIISRGLIQLARVKYEQGTCQSKPLVNTAAYWRGCVKIGPPYPTSSAPRPDPSPDTRRKPSGQFLPYLDRYKYIFLPALT